MLLFINTEDTADQIQVEFNMVLCIRFSVRSLLKFVVVDVGGNKLVEAEFGVVC
jgi:hypothetical protein